MWVNERKSDHLASLKKDNLFFAFRVTSLTPRFLSTLIGWSCWWRQDRLGLRWVLVKSPVSQHHLSKKNVTFRRAKFSGKYYIFRLNRVARIATHLKGLKNPMYNNLRPNKLYFLNRAQKYSCSKPCHLFQLEERCVGRLVSIRNKKHSCIYKWHDGFSLKLTYKQQRDIFSILS